MSDTRRTRTDAGKFYLRWPDGRLRESAPGKPDDVICRRVVDFPHGCPPPGAAVTNCERCHEPIAFNPKGLYPQATKICMQCGGIEPLPIETP